MKALQVKRNSLRSLWRRGLVIFSIFGLMFAFAACNRPVDPPPGNGNNGPGNGLPPPPARHVVDMSVLRGSQVMNFEGQVSDLTGLRVSLTWSDGTVTFSENPAEFYTIPYVLNRDSPATFVGVAPGAARATGFFVQFNPSITVAAYDILTHGSIVRLHHRSNADLYRAFPLPFVRALNSDDGDPIHVTGRLTHQNRFEDDLIDFDGVTVEGIYHVANLLGAGGATVGTSLLLAPGVPQTLPAALRENHPQARSVIALNHAHLDMVTAMRPLTGTGDTLVPSSNVGGIETDPTNNLPLGGGVRGRGMRLQISQEQVFLPIANWFPISHVMLESINPAGFPDIFQFWSGALDWPAILFTQANLRLRVHYNGTAETRIVDWERFRRAQALGVAAVFPPNLVSADVDEMIAQVMYFGVRPAGQAPWQPGDHAWVNRTVDVQIPVLEFDGSIAFQRRPTEVNVPNIVWPHVSTHSWLPHENLVEAIWRTYDLVAIYAGGRTLSISYLIGRQVPGGQFELFSTGESQMFRNRIINGSTSPGEIEEAEVFLRFPYSVVPGASLQNFWTNAWNARGNNLDWRATVTRQAFIAAPLEEEIQLQVLPRPPGWVVPAPPPGGPRPDPAGGFFVYP